MQVGRTLTAIRNNLERVQERMSAAAQRAGREAEEITLVGVTKTHPPELIVQALEAGLRHIGENRLEEMDPKRRTVEERLTPDAGVPVWHMVGHVQSRKAARAVEVADVIHSLESRKLAGRLDRFAAQAGKVVPVLLEVNLSGEESKYGLPADRWESDAEQWGALLSFVEAVLALPNLRLQGLMTMAPWVMDETIIRPVFRSARRLRERMAMVFQSADWEHLSMGMTDDFEIAIEEGATMIRVGRAIFGARRLG